VRPRTLLALTCLLAGCPRGSSAPSSLERLGDVGQEEVCSGTLSAAIDEVRTAGGEEAVPRLVGAVRWAVAHSDVECNPVITARQLWQESVRALSRIGGESAGLGLIVSLSESHRPGSVHDRHNAASRLETAAALRLLSQESALEPEVVDALLDWYGAGGRCAPGWLLSDVFEAVDEPLQAQIVDELSRGEGEDRIARIAAALQTTTGPLRDVLARFACDGALESAVVSFDTEDADPAAAVEAAVGACGAYTASSDDINALRQRLTEWHVERGEAEEAWLVLETLPEDQVDARWRSEVGVPVIFARLERGGLMDAVEMLETLTAELGAGHTDLQPVRGVVERALLTSAEESWEARSLPDVQLLVTTARRIFGESDGTRRYDFIIRLTEAATIASEEDCRPRAEIRRLHRGVESARDLAAEQYEDDEAITTLSRETWRRWRVMVRRCY